MSPKKEWYETFFAGLYGRVLADAQHEGYPGQGIAQIQARVAQGMLEQYEPDILLLLVGGLAVTGVDLRASFCRRARRGAALAGVRARFQAADMLALDFNGEFDAVVNWFTSFGYFSNAGNLAFCRRVLAALKPGGRFLIETVNGSWLPTHVLPRTRETIAGVTIDHAHRWNARSGRMISTWTFRHGRRIERRRLSVRMYTGTEMRRLLKQAGFVDIRLLGRPPLGPFTRHSRRLLALARRPGGRSGQKSTDYTDATD
ncbi:MAG: methyltransferase domain-containing protein [Planctomycetota bacterium]|nr:methyltransferase domain-containing protein [Planctomycetota bacterium]